MVKSKKQETPIELGSNTRGEVVIQVGKYIYHYLFPSLGAYSRTKIKHSYIYKFKGGFIQRRILKFSILSVIKGYLIERQEYNGNIPKLN